MIGAMYGVGLLRGILSFRLLAWAWRLLVSKTRLKEGSKVAECCSMLLYSVVGEGEDSKTFLYGLFSARKLACDTMVLAMGAMIGGFIYWCRSARNVNCFGRVLL